MNSFKFAQPAMIVDGLLAVPINISQVNATISFDLTTAVASVDVTMDFSLGTTAGCPTFDLRQTITQAWLDGVEINTALLAHHNVGLGLDSKLRILALTQAAGSGHTLRLTYPLDQPDATQSNPIGWNGNRLSFDFWFTDLYPGRYLEMWLPANLLWDHYPVSLDIELIGSTVGHTLISNGSSTSITANHWSVVFPPTWNASCQMLVIEPTSDLSSRAGSLVLPDGSTIATEIYKHDSVSANLATVESQLHSFLSDNVTDVGAYAHQPKFTLYLWPSSRAMEYAAGTTTKLAALSHETFHSWFARGVFPANGQDGWWDEAITSWVGAGRPESPLSLSESRSTLCDRNRYSRVTSGASYSRGLEIFAGLAEEQGVADLNSALAGIYRDYKLQALSTEVLEAELITRLGDLSVADYFERYVYGMSRSLGADLWLRDAVGDPGFNNYTGSRFWDSPDLWVRNNDDDGSVHQAPESGQDNWFYARVRNRGSQAARHFVLTFRPATFAGSQFVYPNDWLPPITTTVGFDLAPGASTVVKARWPRSMVPVAGTHSCLLASVYTTADQAINGRHVWEHNNLAQKNLTVVDLLPDDVYALDFQFGSILSNITQKLVLEVRRPTRLHHASVKIVPRDPRLLERIVLEKHAKQKTILTTQHRQGVRFLNNTRASIGGIRVNVNRRSEIHPISAGQAISFDNEERAWRSGVKTVSSNGVKAISLKETAVARIGLQLNTRETQKLGLEVQVPSNAKPGTTLLYDVLQRDAETGAVIGGVSLQVNVINKRRH